MSQRFQTLQGTLSLFTRLPTLCFVPFPSFHPYLSLALSRLSVRFSPFHSLFFSFGYLLSTLLCHTLAAPGLLARTRSRATLSSRTRTRAGHVTIKPATALYTMGPAHAPASGSHLGRGPQSSSVNWAVLIMSNIYKVLIMSNFYLIFV